MATVDVVARLQLRAEQFSSETGQRFAELKQRARSAAQDLRQEFSGAFSEVQRLAQTSLQLPRTDFGSLNLGPEIAQLNAAAAAADQKAIANRELSGAMQQAAGAAGVDRQALLLEADAAAVASLAAEDSAQAIRQRILALEAVQAELNQTTSETRRLTQAEEDAARTVKRTGAGFTNLGQQFIDFTVQVESGQKASVAFAQQLPQAAFALSTMAGAAGKVGEFLTGPWGTALTIATIVTTPFVAKLFEGADGADKARGASLALVDALSQLRSATDEARQAIEDYNAAQDHARKTDSLAAEESLRAAKARLQEAIAAREAAQAELERQRAYQALPGTSVAGLNPGVAAASSNAEDQAKRINELQQAIRNLNIEVGASDAKAAADPIVAINRKFDRMADAAKRAAAGNDKLNASIGSTLAAIEKQRQAELDAQRELDRKPPKPKRVRDYTRTDNSAEEAVARINAAWDEQPRLIDRARVDTLKLDNLIEELSKRKLTPEVEKLIAAAQEAKAKIQEGLSRPFEEFVQQQRESLAIGEQVLAGRDAEAAAMQDALQIQRSMGALTDDELATLLDIEKQHIAIARALEDQRRVVNVYVGGLRDAQGAFEGFLANLQDGRVVDGLKGLASGFVESYKKVQRDLISNAVFGGVDRQIEDYIRQQTGRKTPAMLLEEQAADAGRALHDRVGDAGDALQEFIDAVRGASTGLGALADGRNAIEPTGASTVVDLGRSIGGSLAASRWSAATLTGGGAANDNSVVGDDIVVTGRHLDSAAEKFLKATDVFEVAAHGLLQNLQSLTGIKLPEKLQKSIEKDLGAILQGATLGQLGGGLYSSLTGQKQDPLGSAIGGVLGDVGGKALGKGIEKAVSGGLGKALGSAAGPLGAIAGGVLGSLVGGLFRSIKWSNASLSLNQFGDVVGGQGTGKGSQAIAAATGAASSVATGVNQIADQLGAKILSLPALTLGTWDGKYRVADTSTNKSLNFNNFGSSVLHDFGSDQQAAIEYAVRYSISHAVISGISQASQNILKSGQDLQSAISKALLIESVPKDLKAILDPVGAAIDELNTKFQHTVDALKEGGATAEQLAQAQQLYDLQLQQIKNSTASASQGLRDFLDSLKLGSSSPYSLRDQEAAALNKLQPFLAQINSGERVDQDKYQAAAQAYLDIERQLYGSTDKFFTAFDAIQAATTKAITDIDNAVPVTPGVESPFAKETAGNTASSAKSLATANELLAQMSDQLADLTSALREQGISTSSNYIGTSRSFSSVAA